MRLNDLKLYQVGEIKKVNADKGIKKRLMDVGFIKGVKVRPVLIKKNIRAYMIKNTVVSVRCTDTEGIEV